MEWTDKIPSEPGWYGYHLPGHSDSECVELFEGPVAGEMVMLKSGMSIEYRIPDCLPEGTLFCGPIKFPPVPVRGEGNGLE